MCPQSRRHTRRHRNAASTRPNHPVSPPVSNSPSPNPSFRRLFRRSLIGLVAADGIGMSWSDHTVEPAVVVPAEPNGDWRVRISARAAAKIAQEVRQWPGVETGGIVMGRISEAARCFYVVDTLPAPSDSGRTLNEFLLGTDGVRRMISDYAESCGYSLFCLGTWHNHLSVSGASITDRNTAATVGLARPAPSVLLIHTPAGFRALLAVPTSTD